MRNRDPPSRSCYRSCCRRASCKRRSGRCRIGNSISPDMAALPGTNSDNATIIPVVDFRRQGMVLQWHALGGTWAAYDNPPALVHGIALINAAEPNVCLYAQSGNLVL